MTTKSKPKKTPVSATAEMARRRNAWQTAANRKSADALRDIGKLPKVVNPSRKAAARKSLQKYCETYFPDDFNLGWSPDHIRLIDKMQTAILKGGLFAFALPRATGKTTITEAATSWATNYGYRKFILLIGATQTNADELLESIRVALLTNDLLLEDFPEVCYPIRKKNELHTHRINTVGKPVEMKIDVRELRLPYVVGGRNGKAAGAIIRSRPIKGALRGMKVKRWDGITVRPDFVIADDPQTDEDAANPETVKKIEKTINGAVLGLAGPGNKISVAIPCTVIEDDDFSDRVLSSSRWNGLRVPFVKTFPEELTGLWEVYHEKLDDSFRKYGDIRDATKYYRANRDALDRGCSVSWDARFEPDEASAVQHAMNKLFGDRHSFFCEMQNDPRQAETESERIQTPSEIASRVNGLDQYEVISGATNITGFVDVQGKALFYSLVAWRDDFTGAVIDYGTWPEQNRRYYTLNDITRTLQREYPGAGQTGLITKGLSDCLDMIEGRRYVRENDGAEMQPNLILVDANWQSDTVRDVIRRRRTNSVAAAHGRFVDATSTPISEHKKKPGERVGINWKTSTIAQLKHVLYDSNWWKSFLHERLTIPFGDPSSVSFYGRSGELHRMLADNLTAENRQSVRAVQSGRECDVWKLKPSRPDNHFFDGLVGAAVAASVMGARLHSQAQPKTKKRRKRRVSYM